MLVNFKQVIETRRVDVSVRASDVRLVEARLRPMAGGGTTLIGSNITLLGGIVVRVEEGPELVAAMVNDIRREELDV